MLRGDRGTSWIGEPTISELLMRIIISIITVVVGGWSRGRVFYFLNSFIDLIPETLI